MKRNMLLMWVCFAAGLLGANVQPILTGAGKLLFPEASPAAYLQASSGALTIAAGGANRNVTLTPSGTGMVSVTGTNANFDAAGVIRSSGYTSTVPLSGPGLELLYSGGGVIQAYDRTAAAYQPLGLSGSTILLGGPVSTTGNLDVGGIYKKGGVSGVNGSISVSTTTASAVTGVTPATGSGVISVSYTTGSIQYKDWAGANQTATFVTGVSFTTGSFVVSVTPSTASFLTGATASANTFSGGIRTN